MANPGYNDDDLRAALAAYNKAIEDGYIDGGSPSARQVATEALGLNDTTFIRRLNVAIERGLEVSSSKITPPEFPPDDDDIDNIINSLVRRTHKRLEHHKARTWPTVKIPIDGAIGLLWFGDPHVDDNGCNWPLLKRDIEIAKNTEGVYGCNIGDTTNNWVGRLMRKFADQDTSQATARKLAQWFLNDAGIDWLIWLLGNHDEWNDGGTILKLMNRENRVYMEDWQARFKIQFPNGRVGRIHAAHDFKGHSQYNPLHANQKNALWKAEADLYIAGHRHNWALSHFENPDRDHVYWLARCRGYKFADEFGEKLGYMDQTQGAAIMSVFDPDATTPAAFLQCFADAEEGADYLTWKRSRSQ